MLRYPMECSGYRIIATPVFGTIHEARRWHLWRRRADIDALKGKQYTLSKERVQCTVFTAMPISMDADVVKWHCC